MTVMVFTEQYSAIAFSSRVHSSSVRQPFAFWMSSTKPAGEIAVPVALLSDFATPAACLSVRAAGMRPYVALVAATMAWAATTVDRYSM